MLLCVNILHCWEGTIIALEGKEMKAGSGPWAHAGADTVSNVQMESLAHPPVLCLVQGKGREMPSFSLCCAVWRTVVSVPAEFSEMSSLPWIHGITSYVLIFFPTSRNW